MPPKTLISFRLPADLMESIDTMAVYRQEDRTTLLVRMLRFAQVAKAAVCPHEVISPSRVCLECGHRFIPDPTDF